ncbi:MAG: sugar phosphate isomerase/epimerase family protein [Streptosporangiaceae bacterium]
MARVKGLEHLTLLGLAPPEFVRVAARAGFAAVGLRVAPVAAGEEPWPMSPGSPMLAQTVRRCADAGIEVLGVEAVRLGPRALDCEPVLEAAAELGARYVNAVCEDHDLGRLSDRFGELVRSALPYGVRPVIEFMAYRSVRSLRDAVAIAAGSGGGGLLLDALHIRRCGVDLGELNDLDPGLLGYLQLCDAPLTPPPDQVAEARTGRLLPGHGELPLADLLAAVPGNVPVAVEAPHPDGRRAPEEFAIRARRALDLVLTKEQ